MRAIDRSTVLELVNGSNLRRIAERAQQAAQPDADRGHRLNGVVGEIRRQTLALGLLCEDQFGEQLAALPVRPAEEVDALVALRLGLAPGGDVEEHPLPDRGTALVAGDDGGGLLDPDDAPVRGDQAVLGRVGVSRLVDPIGELDRPVAVVLMQDRAPQGRIREPSLDGVAKHRFDLRGDIERAEWRTVPRRPPRRRT
jgi:hypothetical protein